MRHVSKRETQAIAKAGTRRKTTAQRLEDSELKYRRLFEAAQDGILILNGDTGHIIDANPFVADLLGYMWTELVGKHLWEIGAFKDIDASKIAYEELQQKNYIRYSYLPLETKDKRLIDVEFVSNAYQVDGSRIIQCNIRDVTEHTKIDLLLQQKREQSEERYHSLFENMLNGFAYCQMLFDGVQPQDFIYLDVNDSFEKQIGLKNVVGKKVSEVIPGLKESSPELFETYARVALTGQSERFEFYVPQLDIWLDVSVYSQERGYFIAVFDNITERKRAEVQLKESESKYRTLAENLPQKVFFKDKNSVYISCNENYARDLKIESGGIAGKTDYDFFPKELAEKYKQDDKRIIESGRAEDIEEKYIQDGRENWVYTVKTPVKDKYNNIVGLLGIFWDVTEHKILEEERKTYFEKLQKAVEGAISAIAFMAEIRDPYTAGHQQRVARLACAIAEELGFPEEKIETVRIAGALHDIGKVQIPAEILSKPGKLNEIEMSLIKSHSQVSYDILKTVELPWPVCPIVLQHHERMDGSGYPSGTSGKDILLEARILSVADVVEAMASHRPYRPALGIDKALEEISQNKGTLYDPNVVDACVRLFIDKGFTFE